MDPLDAPKDVQQKQRAGWRLVSFFGDNKWAFSQDQRMVDFEPHIEQYEQQKGCNKMKVSCAYRSYDRHEFLNRYVNRFLSRHAMGK